MNSKIRRRHLLQSAGGFLAASVLSPGLRRAVAQSSSVDAPAPRYLFVVGALGGANILDSFLPLAETASPEAPGLTSFAEPHIETVPGVGLRCVAPLTEELAGPPPYAAEYSQRTFLERHGIDTAVMTLDHSSVNHGVGQQRALNAGGVNSGRTLLEAAAACHGESMPLAALNMMTGEFSQPGSDPALPPHARQVAVADARTFALGTHGSMGLPLPVSHDALQRARAARENLEHRSAFGKSFAHVTNREDYLRLRSRAQLLEQSGLAQNVDLLGLPGFPRPTPMDRILELLPNLARDPFEAQAALAFLLVSSGASCAVGISPSDALLVEAPSDETESGAVSNPALAFDASHNSHRVGQHVMWSRLLRVTDALITLLKETEDPNRGEGASLWDHSLVYVATEFGRTRGRPPGFARFGTGHFQNNGVVLASPMLNGGRVYGGVDVATGLTYGFERESGAPAAGLKMNEADVYGVVCEALDVNYGGRRSSPSIVR